MIGPLLKVRKREEIDGNRFDREATSEETGRTLQKLAEWAIGGGVLAHNKYAFPTELAPVVISLLITSILVAIVTGSNILLALTAFCGIVFGTWFVTDKQDRKKAEAAAKALDDAEFFRQSRERAAQRRKDEREAAARAAKERAEAVEREGLLQVDAMSGIEFEKYVAKVMRRRGYRVSLTKATGDFGVDLVAVKHGVTTAVQCKRSVAAVGAAAVQQVVAGAKIYSCSETMVVCSSSFTQGAVKLAKVHDCKLVDRASLEATVIKIYRERAAGEEMSTERRNDTVSDL